MGGLKPSKIDVRSFSLERKVEQKPKVHVCNYRVVGFKVFSTCAVDCSLMHDSSCFCEIEQIRAFEVTVLYLMELFPNICSQFKINALPQAWSKEIKRLLYKNNFEEKYFVKEEPLIVKMQNVLAKDEIVRENVLSRDQETTMGEAKDVHQ